MGRLVEKLNPDIYAPMQWHTQARNITTNTMVKIYFTLPALNAKNVVMWKDQVNDSAKGGYNMILGRDLLTKLGLNLKLSEHVIEAYDGHFKESTTPMVYLGTYIFKSLIQGNYT